MELVIDKHAQRRLLGMPAKVRSAMLDRLKAIAADPFAGHAQVKPLRGERGAFRLRHGAWRALYRVDRAAQEVRVYVIETRARAYR
ncbi:MAG: type II toxin-antitoxin system RelE family toxin [Geminicoccaceae bacterium]